MTAYEEDEILEALQTTIETGDDYNDKNVALGDPEILNRGFDRCVIVDGGEIRALESPYKMMGSQHTRYSPVVQVFHRYTRDKESRAALREDCAAIMRLIAADHTLGDTVEKCLPRLAGKIEYAGNLSGSGPFYVFRRITVDAERIEEL
jgi:hypothetical protein